MHNHQAADLPRVIDTIDSFVEDSREQKFSNQTEKRAFGKPFEQGRKSSQVAINLAFWFVWFVEESESCIKIMYGNIPFSLHE